VLRWVCDRPERIPARVFLALAGAGWDATQCPCCNFWRGVVVGVAGAGIVAMALRYV
jgi:hypothetical protein